MKTTIVPGNVVVATDGSDDAHRAVGWAAEQAYLDRRSLTVVTAVGTAAIPAIVWPDMAAGYAYLPGEMLEHGEEVAREAVALARHLRPGLEVDSVVLHGDPRQVLIDACRRSHLLVLGSRGRGVLRSKVLGSVSAAVSRDALCPVVVCRPHGQGSLPDRGVLVGADGTLESLPIIEFAFQQASLSGVPLTVVHCLWDETATAGGRGAVAAREPGLDELRLLLSESVAGMAEKFPEVSVDLQLARGLAEVYLSSNTAGWNLVVVGRHAVDTVFQFLTGAVATAVVERARTTVAVVPECEPADPDEVPSGAVA